MPIQATKLITVHAVTLNNGSLFSRGIGFDEEGNPIDFIGHTPEMRNINESLEDFEDDNSLGRPSIWLKPWQWQDDE